MVVHPVINPSTGGLRQENHSEFKASLKYIVRPCLKKSRDRQRDREKHPQQASLCWGDSFLSLTSTRKVSLKLHIFVLFLISLSFLYLALLLGSSKNSRYFIEAAA